VVVDPSSFVVLNSRCVVMVPGSYVIIEQWLCGSGSRFVSGTYQ
jgi:hypothetical protein